MIWTTKTRETYLLSEQNQTPSTCDNEIVTAKEIIFDMSLKRQILYNEWYKY